MWLFKDRYSSYFQRPSFPNDVRPISRPNFWCLLKRSLEEWERKVAYLKNGLTSIAMQCLQQRHCTQLWDLSFCSEVLLQAISKMSLPPVLTLVRLKSKLFPVCFVPFCQHQGNSNFFHSLDDPEALSM